MPSPFHQVLVSLFRERPRLAADLLRHALGVRLAPGTRAAVADATVSELAPADYHPDLVLVHRHGANSRPRYGIVLEVQLARRRHKQFTWPLYAAALRARLRAPVCVVVVALNARVAAWAAQPIDTGQIGWPFTPLVLGPEAVPRITDLRVAHRAPELAVLSAIAHGNTKGGEYVAKAAVTVTRRLDLERARIYADVVVAALSAAARSRLEALMLIEGYVYQSDFARKYYGQGMAKGKAEGKTAGRAEALLRVLAARGLRVGRTTRARILACTRRATLDRWLTRAASATSVREVLGR